MKNSTILIFAGLSLFVGMTSAKAVVNRPAIPPGSYRLSCYAAVASGDSLSAQCRTLAGTEKTSTLNALGQCKDAVMKGGDIANLDGNLVCVPNLPQTVSGEAFPQSETTINSWVYGGKTAALYRHSWAIWGGLTHFTGMVNGIPVRAFQTWATPSNMIYRIQSGIGFNFVHGTLLLEKSRLLHPRGRFELQIPHQFRNIKPTLTAAQSSPYGDPSIFVKVAYNPAAAHHAIFNKLFLQSTLNRYIKQGYTQIPVFPASAITIKPVYKIIRVNEPNDYVKNGIYTMPGWPGTPVPATAFPAKDWMACVYVNIKDTGTSGSSIDQGCKGRTRANTFHLADFIRHTITADEKDNIFSETNMSVSAGDIAILVGMHVTTRETTRWTWQTFWWSANANQPYAPSTKAIAAARPATALDRAANHYAMAVAYQMVTPAQPITGGQSVGKSAIAYNPYLEAQFDPGVFQAKGTIDDDGKVIDNIYGVQSNCMTCHGLAQYQLTPHYYKIKDGANREKPYAADFYFSLSDPSLFKNKLQLDFAWSVVGFLVLDDDSGG